MTTGNNFFYVPGIQGDGWIWNTIYRFSFFIAIVLVGSCSSETKDDCTSMSDSVPTNSGEDGTTLWRSCSFSNKEFAYEIDSCNCGDIVSTGDTVFIYLAQAEGGEVQGHLLKIQYPECDGSDYILMKHQNRYWTSSMGPDPVFHDWILYNSPFDTIHYDPKRNGFYINSISEVEQGKFPKFDTLDFYKAYERTTSASVNSTLPRDIGKSNKKKEDSNFKKRVKEILEQSSVELHRIILVLSQGNSRKKVIVFTYQHMG